MISKIWWFFFPKFLLAKLVKFTLENHYKCIMGCAIILPLLGTHMSDCEFDRNNIVKRFKCGKNRFGWVPFIWRHPPPWTKGKPTTLSKLESSIYLCVCVCVFFSFFCELGSPWVSNPIQSRSSYWHHMSDCRIW